MSDNNLSGYFDNLEYVKKLKEVGFTQEQSEMQAKVMGSLLSSSIVSKDDLENLRRDIETISLNTKRGIDEFIIHCDRIKDTLSGEFEDITSQLSRDVSEIRVSNRRETEEIRRTLDRTKTEVKRDFDEINKNFDRIKVDFKAISNEFGLIGRKIQEEIMNKVNKDLGNITNKLDNVTQDMQTRMEEFKDFNAKVMPKNQISALEEEINKTTEHIIKQVNLVSWRNTFIIGGTFLLISLFSNGILKHLWSKWF